MVQIVCLAIITSAKMPIYLQNYTTSYLNANKINHIQATHDPVCIVMMTQCNHLMICGTCLMQQTTHWPLLQHTPYQQQSLIQYNFLDFLLSNKCIVLVSIMMLNFLLEMNPITPQRKQNQKPSVKLTNFSNWLIQSSKQNGMKYGGLSDTRTNTIAFKVHASHFCCENWAATNLISYKQCMFFVYLNFST